MGCSGDFAHCVTWCGSGLDNCLNCNQDVHWICGEQRGCKPRWYECTKNPDACCDGLTCVQVNSHYSQCQYVEGPPPECVHCDDEETPWMKKNNHECTSSVVLDQKCNKSDRWLKKKYCQLSCYNRGYGYTGDVCCNGTPPTSAPTSSAPVSSAPVTSPPITLPPVTLAPVSGSNTNNVRGKESD